MTPIEHLNGIWGLSGAIWLVFGFFSILIIKGFIVKRYEEETPLGRTVFFTRHMPFARYMPDFFSSSLYCGHLLAFIWCWRIIKFIKEKRKKVTYFDDVDSREAVTGHFSAKEIRRVKMVAVTGFILFLHGIAYLIFRSVWPEVFGG